jgi:hypothetical protein
MKTSLLLSAVLLIAVGGFADTTINNFTGYNDGWNPFGDPAYATQTFGEIFTAPDGVNKRNRAPNEGESQRRIQRSEQRKGSHSRCQAASVDSRGRITPCECLCKVAKRRG